MQYDKLLIVYSEKKKSCYEDIANKINIYFFVFYRFLTILLIFVYSNQRKLIIFWKKIIIYFAFSQYLTVILREKFHFLKKSPKFDKRQKNLPNLPLNEVIRYLNFFIIFFRRHIFKKSVGNADAFLKLVGESIPAADVADAPTRFSIYDYYTFHRFRYRKNPYFNEGFRKNYTLIFFY